MKKTEIEALYLANSLQQGFIYHALSQTSDDAYRVQIVFDYKQPLQVDHYVRAWELAIAQYPMLRTAFNWEEELIQIIYSDAKLNYKFRDISGLSGVEQEAYIVNLQQEDRKKTFDLTKPSLLRLFIIKLTDNHYTILKSEHHSITDGWSGPILINSVHDYYEQLQKGQPVKVKVDSAYLRAQSYFAKNKHKVETFWQEKTAHMGQTNDLNPLLSNKQDLDNIKSISQPFDTDIVIGGELYQQLKALTKSTGVTLNILVQFAWHKLIQVYTQDRQTIVGTTVSGRAIPVAGIEKSVGLYINTLPLIIDWDNDHTVLQQIQNIHRQTTELNRHSFVNLASLQEQGKRLFHSLFVYENYPMPTLTDASDENKLSPQLKYAVEKLDYPIGLAAYELADQLVIKLKSDGQILSEEKADDNLSKISMLLEAIVGNLDQKHRDLTTMSRDEYQQIVVDWNAKEVVYPQDKTLHQLFEAQMAKTPDNIAIVFHSYTLTYAQLNVRSNQLARTIVARCGEKSASSNSNSTNLDNIKLDSLTIKPDTLIGLCVDRGPEMIIGILAILKAGGAYVPIDPQYPADRIHYIINDSKIELVLTQSHLSEQLEKISQVSQLVFDGTDYQNNQSENLTTANKATDLAYVIYTSGTTGQPKGVLQLHGNVQRLFGATEAQFHFDESDVWTLYHSYIFDFSVWEMWGALLHGGKLVIPDNDEVKDISRFVSLCKAQQVSVLNQTPAAFYAFSENLTEQESASLALKYIIFGGDTLNVSLLGNWWQVKRQYNFPTRLINMYGITETTVHVTYKEIIEGDKNATSIGKPIADLTSYVLNANLLPVPVGVTGELYIGGAGLARGYLNQPQLTQQKFIDNPFVQSASKLYKTGDLVRWITNGELEYVGRNDFQVKIRGYRIELGEIEQALGSIASIKQTCVLAKQKDGRNYLVAYYVPHEHASIDQNTIIAYLESCLPEYMVPIAYVELVALPLTINGKLDRKALPDADFSDQKNYVAPSTDLQVELCAIWQKVLKLEKVGIYDDFFSVGGDSIISIRLVSQIKSLGIDIAIKDILIHKNIANLAKNLRYNSLNEQHYQCFSLVDKKQTQNLVENLDEITDIYPACHLQTGMLIESELANDGTYHDVFSYGINKKFDASRFNSIVTALIEKHELLRASLVQSEQGYYTVIHKKLASQDKINVVDESGSIKAFIENEKLKGFDYQSTGLFRFYVLNQIEDSFVLVFSFHHAITDGWSVASLIAEFADAYVNNIPVAAQELPHYGEYVQQQKLAIDNQNHKTFWIDYLKGYETNHQSLRLDGDTLPVIKNQQMSIDHPLEVKQNTRILQLAEQYSTSVDVIFMALYQHLLSVMFNKSDVIIGMVVNNRLEKEGGDKLFGLHLNTIALRQTITGESVARLFTQTRDNKNRVYEHKAYPYGKVKSDLGLFDDVYQCIFNYTHFHVAQSESINRAIDGSDGFEKTNIPLTFNVSRHGDDFVIVFNSNQQFIDQNTLVKLKDYFVFYLEQLLITRSDALILNNIPLQEYEQIIHGWNNTAAEYPKDQTFTQLFEQQVSQTPEKVAVVFEGQSLSYAELNGKANQLAKYIQSKAVIQPDTLIALCLERSLEMSIAILAVMKAGGAYVPIDPEFPPERTRFIFEDSAAVLVLTQSNWVESLKSLCKVDLVVLDSDNYQGTDGGNLPAQNDSSDLAYVIYTSGTTGNPKGAFVNHQLLVNRLVWQKEQYGFDRQDTVLQKTPYVFDVSVWELLLPLISGSKLVFARVNGHKDPQYLLEILEHEQITMLHFVPSMFNAFYEHLANQATSLSTVQQIFCSGEALPVQLVQNFKTRFPAIKIHNLYGPTEVAIDVSAYDDIAADVAKVHIGKPIQNIKFYVLNDNLAVVPIGVVGELHIAGADFSRGYLNHPQLSEQKFINNPFATQGDKLNSFTKLYKTGDLVRWLPDGNVEYLGRNDFQVKIRGMRIELGEIENQLTQIDQIKQACVLIKEKQSNPYLIAYYVADEIISSSNLVNTLSIKLPEHMIPDCFVAMDIFPVSSNGKLDTKVFPEPQFDANSDYVAPRTEIEQQICSIWENVLQIEKVGIHENFFGIGGNSILAIKLGYIMRQSFSCQVGVAAIFSHKTVVELAKFVAENNEQGTGISVVERAHNPLSFAQERLWFIEQYEQGTNAYHIPILIKLSEGTSLQKFTAAIEQVVRRHQVLSTIFAEEDGLTVQKVVDQPLSINEYHYGEVDIEQQIRDDINRTFDLQRNLPIRLSCYHQAEAISLLINIHHIAFDGWSTDILLQEINALYHNEKLAALPVQYKDFAYWQREHLQNELLDKQVHYWKEQLSGYQPLALPTDKGRPKLVNYQGEECHFRIDEILSNQLRTLSTEQGCSLYVTLLCGFYILLAKHSGQEDIVLGTPMANREYGQIQDLIGFFVNTLVLRANVDSQNSVSKLLTEVQETLTQAQNHQDLPFEQVVEILDIEQDTSRHPIFQVVFTLQSFGEQAKNKLFSPVALDDKYHIAKYDLSCAMDDSQPSITGALGFATSLFEQTSIARMSDHYLRILTQMVADKNQPIKHYNLMSEGEYQQVVVDWPKAEVFAKDQTIHQLFEAQVNQMPDKVALVYQQQTLTYGELNAKANQLARHIQSKTIVKPDTLIALCLDRSPEMIIAILAVLKAGGAYVPIEPDYPAQRISFLLEDCDAAAVLTQSALLTQLKDITAVDLIVLDVDDYQHEASVNLTNQNSADDLAYVIYTSGTTGKPKGVLQLHGNVQRLFSATAEQFGFDHNDIWTLYHSYVFDFSVWEIWGALIHGGKLVIPDQETVKDIPCFVDLCIEQQVTVLNQTPGAFYTFADSLNSAQQASELSIKHIIFGGDALNLRQLDKWWHAAKSHGYKTQLVNMYGITETTVHVTCKVVVEDETTIANIGRSITDLSCYVLDAYNLPVPIGVVGELHVGGAGLARGYLNQVQLTAEKFISNAFVSVSDNADGQGINRLYKTGDLVRWLPSGELQYMGRNDFQIKIRGYRIELGEIENAMATIKQIKQVFVLAKEKNGSRYLAAYYVLEDKGQDNSAQISDTQILQRLDELFPSHMVPSALVQLEHFPLTINGKLDRQALPEPEFANQTHYIGPTNAIEFELCSIWQQVLGLDKVSIEDDFFRIGGDSIISIRVVAQIKKQGINISVRDIFIHKTIAQLAKVLSYDSFTEQRYQPFSLIHRAEYQDVIADINILSDVYPAGYLQAGMLLESDLANDGTYHDVFSYQINKPFDEVLFSGIIVKLIEKHELLRAAFVSSAGGYLCVIHKNVAIEQKINVIASPVDIHDFLEQEKVVKIIYDQPGLYTFHIINQTPDSFVLVFSFHHAITDGWSVASLISEFTAAYIEGTDIINESLPLYGEFVQQEQAVMAADDSKAFWHDYLTTQVVNHENLKLAKKGAASGLAIATKTQLLSNQSLSPEQNAMVFTLAEKYQTSVDVIFMALYQKTLSVLFNESDITIGLVVNNRLEKEGGDKLFGLHLNTIPLRQTIKNESAAMLIQNTRDNKSKVYEYKTYPYGRLRSELNLLEDVYQCAFNYIHFHVVETQYLEQQITGSEGFEKNNLPLMINVSRGGDNFYLSFQSHDGFTDAATIDKLSAYFVDYLQQLSDGDDQSFSFKTLPSAEYQQQLIDWNNTASHYDKDNTIHQLFERQVLKTPDNVAILDQDRQLTYAQLNAKANQLASYLSTEPTFNKNKLIALCCQRNVDMIIAILAILKAGAAYVPIDPDYPTERIHYILKDTQARLILSQTALIERLELPEDVMPIALDSNCYVSQSMENLGKYIATTDLAYVIYTSGTTGQPKGIMVEHQQFSSFLLNFSKQSFIAELENFNVLSLTNYTFDIFGLEYALPLVFGDSVCLANFSDIEAHQLEQATIIQQTPSVMSVVCDRQGDLLKDKLCLVGGEALPQHTAQQLRQCFNQVVNVYGPAECVIWSTCHLLTDEQVLIGQPLYNEKVYVLNDDNAIVPTGVIGELHIGGVGLARGYLNHPQLNTEKFIKNPFVDENDKIQNYTRLYKTGDLVRWLPDGNLEYIGRNDFQVKIRGFRVELGEIENALNGLDCISQSCVVVKQKGSNQQLVAYYVAPKVIENSSLLIALSTCLPEYMIPCAFVHLEQMPLTNNGKLDRRALPEVEQTDSKTYIAPKNDLQIQLCDIWQSLLSGDKVGISDDFFRIGGDSILAVKLAHQISQTLEVSILVVDIFTNNTIEKLSKYIETLMVEVEFIEMEL
jgi:amino acid adenylation domain-containing protein